MLIRNKEFLLIRKLSEDYPLNGLLVFNGIFSGKTRTYNFNLLDAIILRKLLICNPHRHQELTSNSGLNIQLKCIKMSDNASRIKPVDLSHYQYAKLGRKTGVQ